jgi:MFS family permease
MAALLSKNWTLLIAMFLFSAASAQLTSNFVLLLTKVDAPIGMYGLALSFHAIVTLCLMIPISVFAHRLNQPITMASGAFLLALGLLLPPFSTAYLSVFIYVTLAALSSALILCVGPAYASNCVPAAAMGTMHILYGTSFALGISIGPILGVTALENFGIWAYGISTAGCAALSAGIFLRMLWVPK